MKKFKSFLEHNYMKSSSDFVINYISHYVYDIPHVFILTIKWYNLSSYEYVNIKHQKIELKWASIFPAWVEFKLAIKKQAILTQSSSAVQNGSRKAVLHQENMNIWTCLVTLNYTKTTTKYVTVTRDVIARRGPGIQTGQGHARFYVTPWIGEERDEK